jgi:hypothetical protein
MTFDSRYGRATSLPVQESGALQFPDCSWIKPGIQAQANELPETSAFLKLQSCRSN